MFKFIRGIIFFVIFIVFIFILGAGFLLFYTYDYEEITYNKDNEYQDVDVIIGKGLDKSLDNILLSNYENNYVEISFTVDELNSYLIDIIRKDVNEDYLIEQDYIIKANGMCLDSILFIADNDKLSVKARLTGLDFYKTTLTLDAEVAIDDNKVIYVTFNTFSLGNNISIKSDFVLKVFKAFALEFEDYSDFDLNTLTLKIDFYEFLSQSVEDDMLLDILRITDYDIKMKNDDLILAFDSSNLFDGGQELNAIADEGVEEYIATELSNIDLVGGAGNIVLSEEQFNYLISQQFNEVLSNFTKEASIGDSSFLFELDGFYYDMTRDCIYTNLLLNNVVSSVKLMLTTYVAEDNQCIIMNLSSVYLGSYDIVSGVEIFNCLEIDSNTLLLPENIIINDIIISKSNKTITLNVSKII